MSNFLNIKFENHKVPEFKEVKNKDWVYYGDDNMYPEYLIELALRSAKHGAILAGKVNYICGGGIQVIDKGASISSKALSNKFIRQINKDGFFRRMVQDLELFNGFFIEPIPNKAKTKIESINYIPFNKIRVSSDEKTYYYSNDWKSTNQSPEKTGLKEFKPFDPEDFSANQLFYFKIISPKNGKEKNVYPVPEYIGACASIETDIEIANYHLNNIKTGFSVGTIINFNNGVPNDEGKAVVEKMIKQKFQGTDKAGSVAISFNNSAENAPTITSFAPSDLDKQFIEIAKRVEQDIFTGHKITSPMLFGVKTEGQLGGRSEMIDAFELFQNTYVDIRQKMIEDVLNFFGQIFGLTSRLEIKRVQAVLNGLTDSQINSALTPQEVRERLGLPPLKENKDEGAKNIINAINSLSPLVANKVLESMTVTEIRSLVGLTGGMTTTTTTTQTMSKENDLYEVLFEREWNNESDEDCISEFQKQQQFKKKLSTNERAIVDLLSKDELMPSDGIAKILKISVDEVNEMIDSLNKGGYLDGTAPTAEGVDVVDEEGAKTELIEVKYKYDWRPGVTPDNNSREWCAEAMDKYKNQKGWLTREEIELLKNDLGTDVWSTRGGWWNNGKANVPYCRHNWYQMVVKKK